MLLRHSVQTSRFLGCRRESWLFRKISLAHHQTAGMIQTDHEWKKPVSEAKGYEALGQIYDAAVNLGRWRRALDSVAQVVDAKAIALLIRGRGTKDRDRQMLNSAYLDFTRSPWGIYYGLRLSRLQDPDWEYLSQQTVHKPVPDTAIGPDAAELDRRADYRLLRKKIGVGRRLGVRLNSDKVWFDAISVAFDKEVGQVPVSAMNRTQFLLPHLTKAVEIGRTFAQLKSRYSAVLTALDRVKVGMAIALPSGDIIVENAEARRIFDLKDGLTRPSDGRLHCADPDQTAELAQAISIAGDTARGEGNQNEQLMAISRRSGEAPLLVDVSPLKDSKAELDGPLEGALVTIIDPQQVPHVRIDRFIALYGLTPAEAEVCGLLAKGKTSAEIALERDTAPVTTKNQIAAVLGKAGVSRQSELIRLMIRVLPPVE